MEGNNRRALSQAESHGPSLAGLERWLFHKATDEELMIACRKGDTEALEQLYKRYYKQLYGYVARYLYDQDRAEDIVQEVFFRVYNNRENYEPTAKFSSWVYRIARNLCVDDKRRHWSRRVVLNSQLSEDDGGPDFLDFAADRSINARDRYVEKTDMDIIREAIGSLSDEQREVMLLHKYEGLSYKEIAEILGVSPESVKQRAYRAHMRLREILKPMMEEARY